MTKRTQFVVLVLALMVPFFAFVIYASVHYPGGAWPNPWPLWLRYTIPAWFMEDALRGYRETRENATCSCKFFARERRSRVFLVAHFSVRA
jgi:hypothetical protein